MIKKISRYFFLIVLTSLNAEAICKHFSYDSKDQNTKKIAGLICKVIEDSYSDLKDQGIKIQAIEDQYALNKFSNKKLSFVSFFDLEHLVPYSNSGYLIGYSREKLFDKSGSTLSRNAIEAVIAHELAHTVDWKNLVGINSVEMALYRFYSGKDEITKYERRQDIQAIYRGIKSKHYYASGLSEYREWNYKKTPSTEQPYLKEVYYFEAQLMLIEKLARKLNEADQKTYFSKLMNEAPIYLNDIQAIFDTIFIKNSAKNSSISDDLVKKNKHPSKTKSIIIPTLKVNNIK